MKTLIKFIPVLIMLTFIYSCVSDDQFIKLQQNVYTLNAYTNRQNQRILKLENRVNSLKQEINNFKKSLKAEVDLKLNAMELEIKSIQNQLNDISNIVPQAERSSQNNVSEEVTKEAIKDLFDKLSTLENEISFLKEQINQLKEKSTGISSDENFYNQAYSLFTLGKYEDAKNKFEEFIKKFPNSKLIPNAYYWLGECYFKLKNYEKAIINYDEIINKYPKSSKVPAALLKEGIAFMRIGENDGAKIIFLKILQDYPHSPQAKYAKIYLKKLK